MHASKSSTRADQARSKAVGSPAIPSAQRRTTGLAGSKLGLRFCGNRGGDGRLEWREWQDKEGNKRESVEIVADSVQFLGGPADGNGGGYSGAQAGAGNGFAPHSDVPADTSDFQPVGARNNAPADDDIPF